MTEPTSRLKSLTALVIAITALVAACSSFFKPRDDRATQESYDTLAQEIKALNAENQRQHDDLVAMRAYIDGVVHGDVPATRTADAGADAASAATSADAGAPMSAVAPHLTASAHTLAPPPVLAPRPKSAQPPTFAKVKEKAREL
jgi:outer membrane murein-binding lipoprotein Lpp